MSKSDPKENTCNWRKAREKQNRCQELGDMKRELSAGMNATGARRENIQTAVSRNVVQLKSIKAYATTPKGMMGCGCSLLHRQVHEFSARWKAVL